MTTGTCYFVNRKAAEKYYSEYEDDPKRAVEIKLQEGSIKLGLPPLKAGEKVTLDREEGRYFVTTHLNPETLKP